MTVLHIDSWFGHFGGVISICYITSGDGFEKCHKVLHRVGGYRGWSNKDNFLRYIIYERSHARAVATLRHEEAICSSLYDRWKNSIGVMTHELTFIELQL